jgi:hypothetical protein
LPRKRANSKDVKPRENGSRKDASKKRVDSLPKILQYVRLGGTLQRQMVKCGKPNCKCARGELHEAFYLFYSRRGRQLKLYVRRDDVAKVRDSVEARKRRDAAFRAEMKQARAFVRRMMLDAIGVRI